MGISCSRRAIETEIRDVCKGVQAPGGHFEGHSPRRGRTGTGGRNLVVGLFRNYNAETSFNNQEATATKIPRSFTEDHVKIYDAASAQVATSMAKLTGDKMVKQLVALLLMRDQVYVRL